VTRIIAGFAGSIRLAVPARGTRPTSDRVREAIFSALESRDAVAGARVLDLYAGTGALGLEAASRGAATVTLVDKDAGAVRVLRQNADRIRAAAGDATPEIAVVGASAHTFLVGSAGAWDVAFLDPPYDLEGAELGRILDALLPRLAPDAEVVVERAARDPDPPFPSGLTLDRRRPYGDTAVLWLRRT
jgi:16S rRNA (guanine966-N2)-methyltransferase